MEKSHLRRLHEKYPSVIESKTVIALHIRDEYEFMQPELIDELRAKVEPLLRSHISPAESIPFITQNPNRAG